MDKKNWGAVEVNMKASVTFLTAFKEYFTKRALHYLSLKALKASSHWPLWGSSCGGGDGLSVVGICVCSPEVKFICVSSSPSISNLHTIHKWYCITIRSNSGLSKYRVDAIGGMYSYKVVSCKILKFIYVFQSNTILIIKIMPWKSFWIV